MTIALKPGKDTCDNIYLTTRNKEKHKQGEFTLPLLDLDQIDIEIPDGKYGSILTIDSSEFQSTLKDLSCMEGDVVTIETGSSGLVLSSTGDVGTAKFVIGKKVILGPIGEDMEEQKGETISNDFSLKFLQVFTKATKLCTDLKLYLKHEHPIVLDYEISGLGLLRFMLAPRINEDEPVPRPQKRMKNLKVQMEIEQGKAWT